MSQAPGQDDLSAREAAALLGVKLPTLYAYVSRGLLQSRPGPRGRQRRYRRADVEALRGRGRAAVAGALRWGEPLFETRITEMTQEGPRYRGHSAVELARGGMPFESAAELLWSGELPGPDAGASSGPFAGWEPGEAPVDFQRIARLLPEAAPPASCLTLLASAAAARDPGRFDTRPPATMARARSLIRLLAAGLALPGAPERAARAWRAPRIAEVLALATGARPRAAASLLLDRALILMMDHELNASTFAARVTASTGADVYAVVLSGLATLSGPKHGAASDQVEALLAEAKGPEAAERVVHERTRRGEHVPGFGHPFYRAGDARTPVMLEAAFEQAADKLPLRTLAAILEVLERDGRPAPNVDTAIVAVRAALSMPRGSGAGIFAVARCAGWVAHALEQQADGTLLRPRARYVGD